MAKQDQLKQPEDNSAENEENPFADIAKLEINPGKKTEDGPYAEMGNEELVVKIEYTKKKINGLKKNIDDWNAMADREPAQKPFANDKAKGLAEQLGPLEEELEAMLEVYGNKQ